ncbi:HAD family hydrolase [Clostridium sp. LP20]|uniref:HAD family hydrolase n=1 Tax=Clostridium sp. LP20 TaxID=3418665 RepID=UPI003EE5494D
MRNNIEVVFFDLFFTLVIPEYSDFKNENDVLGISKDEWERYSEDTELYLKRATNKKISPKKIIDDIINKMDIDIHDNVKAEILEIRKERFKRSLIEVDSEIINVLLKIKENGKKICLISNADIIDVMYWNKSPLNILFDKTIFSYEVGYLKPKSEIYRIALEKMNVNPQNCIFVGDGGSDELKGAKELGMRTLMTGYLLKREKNQHDNIIKFADYYIEDFKELIKIIED